MNEANKKAQLEEIAVVATEAMRRLQSMPPLVPADEDGVPMHMVIVAVVPFANTARGFVFSSFPALPGPDLLSVLGGLVDAARDPRPIERSDRSPERH